MSNALIRHTNPLNIPQMVQVDPDTVKNNAGGYVYEADLWNRLQRFLILGIEGGSFYVSEEDHVRNNVVVVDKALREDPFRAIRQAVHVSQRGLAHKNDYAMFVIAKATMLNNADAKKLAYKSIQDVCRTGSHILQFVSIVDSMRGWGSGLRKAIANWYLDKGLRELAYQVTKYRSRNDWSHRDVLRKVHPVTQYHDRNDIFGYVTQGGDALENMFIGPNPDDWLKLLVATEQAKKADEKFMVQLIQEHTLTHEYVPSHLRKSPAVWDALLQRMPYGATVRNLRRLDEMGLLDPLSSNGQLVADRLRNTEAIEKSRIHPINILYGMKMYGGKNLAIKNALDDAFYASFDYLVPTGKRHLLALDVSASMGYGYGTGYGGRQSVLCAAEIAAAMLMATVRVEDAVHAVAFAGEIKELPIQRTMRLMDVLRITRSMTFGATDASAAIRYAINNNIDTDAIIMYTDNETWQGRGSPQRWIEEYRQRTGLPTRMMMVATEATQFSIGDPTDPLNLDIAGFSPDVPSVISQFVSGEI